jgi:hypothetical protein
MGEDQPMKLRLATDEDPEMRLSNLMRMQNLKQPRVDDQGLKDRLRVRTRLRAARAQSSA